MKNKIMEVAMSLIQGDEEIEADTPLMEAGITSTVAVGLLGATGLVARVCENRWLFDVRATCLRLSDELKRELPGISLPATQLGASKKLKAVA